MPPSKGGGGLMARAGVVYPVYELNLGVLRPYNSEAGMSKKQNFEVIREGCAKARFGGLFSGGVIPGITAPLKLAAVENNGGLNPEEYFVTNCRLLSAAVTPYRKFDFTREGVLKKAVPLFEGLTLYANHDADVNDWKGLIQEPVWDDQNTPPGINAKAVIDKTVDPKLARGVETKALRSFSVTIWFNYEKSHPDLANFYDRLGEEIDGEMVRFVVTEITNAGEVSVVWEGEDPFAKSFKAAGDPPAQPSQEEATMKLTAAVMTLLGIAAGTDVTEELLEAKINETVTGLKSTITSLETETKLLKVDAEVGVQTLAEARTRAVTLYKAAKGDKAVATFITGVIDKADLETARGLIQEYQLAIDEATPLKCAKCGETLSRRSSVPENHGQALAGKNPADYKV
jgi:hypothetical protein